MPVTTLLAAAAAVNCLNSMYQSNLNRKTQAKRDQQLVKTRQQHDLWVMEQQDNRQYRKLDPLVDYEIEPNTTFVAVADYLPEKAIGSHIRISIEEMLRERSMMGFPVKVLGGGGCIRGDIRGEGMVKQLFFELCEKLENVPNVDLLGSVKLVVCWGSVQPLMGKISPHISVFNLLNHSGELRTGYLSGMILNDDSIATNQSIDLKLSMKMREQLWQSVNFTVDTVSMLSCLQRAYELKTPFLDDIVSQLDDKSQKQFQNMFFDFLKKYKQLSENKQSLQEIEKYEALLQANLDGKLSYLSFSQETENSSVSGMVEELVEDNVFIKEGKLILPKAEELMKRHFKPEDNNNIYITSNIPRDKKGGAKSKYALDIHTNDILLLKDDTLFGSAKNGWLLTDSAIYTSAQSVFHPIQKLKYCDINLNDIRYDSDKIAFRSKTGMLLITPTYLAATVTLFAEFFEELFSTKITRVEKLHY